MAQAKRAYGPDALRVLADEMHDRYAGVDGVGSFVTVITALNSAADQIEALEKRPPITQAAAVRGFAAMQQPNPATKRKR